MVPKPPHVKLRISRCFSKPTRLGGSVQKCIHSCTHNTSFVYNCSGIPSPKVRKSSLAVHVPKSGGLHQQQEALHHKNNILTTNQSCRGLPRRILTNITNHCSIILASVSAMVPFPTNANNKNDWNLAKHSPIDDHIPDTRWTLLLIMNHTCHH